MNDLTRRTCFLCRVIKESETVAFAIVTLHKSFRGSAGLINGRTNDGNVWNFSPVFAEISWAFILRVSLLLFLGAL